MVNKLRNQQEALEHPERVFFEAANDARQADAPQSMFLWPGLQLLGSAGKCTKGVFFTVKSCDPEGVVVEGPDGSISVPAARVTAWLRLCYAICYASCQGLSLPGVVRLETSSPNFTLRCLYVGSSRATSSKLLEVA